MTNTQQGAESAGEKDIKDNQQPKYFEWVPEEDWDYDSPVPIEWIRTLNSRYLRPVPSASVEGKERTIKAYGLTTRYHTKSEKYGYGCAECCNGDRCDEDCTAKYKGNRQNCPHCKGKGWIPEAAALASSPAPAQVGGRDPFVEKHLARVRDKMKESMVEMHIQRNREILKPSIEHFLSGGNVNGQFRQSLLKMMNPAIFAAPSADAGKCAGVWRDALPLPKYPGDKHWRDCIIDSPLTWEEADKRISNGMPETVQWLESAPQREGV